MMHNIQLKLHCMWLCCVVLQGRTQHKCSEERWWHLCQTWDSEEKITQARQRFWWFHRKQTVSRNLHPTSRVSVGEIVYSILENNCHASNSCKSVCMCPRGLICWREWHLIYWREWRRQNKGEGDCTSRSKIKDATASSSAKPGNEKQPKLWEPFQCAFSCTHLNRCTKQSYGSMHFCV